MRTAGEAVQLPQHGALSVVTQPVLRQATMPGIHRTVLFVDEPTDGSDNSEFAAAYHCGHDPY